MGLEIECSQNPGVGAIFHGLPSYYLPRTQISQRDVTQSHNKISKIQFLSMSLPSQTYS